MRCLVVYHSRFGNCRRIAENIARGLEEAGLEVELRSSSEARRVGAGFDLLALGSGTRMGRMTGPMRRFIRREIRGEAWAGKPFLAFGTGMRAQAGDEKHADWSARGAQRIYEALEAKGLKPASREARFYVSGMKGPLEDGEEERALELGREVGRRLSAPVD